MQNRVSTLKESIAHLAFPSGNASTSRRLFRLGESSGSSINKVESTPSPSRKKEPSKDVDDSLDAVGFNGQRRAKKRGYAGPETYAHLNELEDYLAPNLDVMFCGINPGHKSASTGHHFAGPTNHFWKCLHLSGFTPRRLPPAEDSTLPSMYNLGLTNLVKRPSIEQAELSKDEMKQSVPSLKAKIVAYRPHIVCFVGKGIWDIVEAAFKAQIAQSHAGKTGTGTPSPRKNTFLRPTAKHEFDWGLQPYKFVYSRDGGVAVFAYEDEVHGSPSEAIAESETLLFVVPNTSGRVVSHQLRDKVELFLRLRDDLEKAKAKALDTSHMSSIPLT